MWSVPSGTYQARRPAVSKRQEVHRRDVRTIHRKEAVGMSKGIEDFCRDLLDDDLARGNMSTEDVAARFVSYFGVKGRPAMPELRALLEDAGFGTVSGAHLDSLKGVHFSAPDGGYDIRYRHDLWAHGTPRDLRDHLRDAMRSGIRLAAQSDGVQRGRPLRGSRADAAGGVLAHGRGVGAGRAGPSTSVPLLIRLSDAEAGGDGT